MQEETRGTRPFSRSGQEPVDRPWRQWLGVPVLGLSLSMVCGCGLAFTDGEAQALLGDNDGDGFQSCTVGVYASPCDCDDSRLSISPDAPETCDGTDNNCDGKVDEEVTITLYRDADADSYGDPKFSIEVCSSIPGYVENGEDCDDLVAHTYPSAPEICDTRDNNCDGLDEDRDDDGYCNELASGDDCDDDSVQAYPGAPELLDLEDNNCNGEIDEGLDEDMDGYLAVTSEGESWDCNDKNPNVYPGATEVCDQLDNDCDRQVDELVVINGAREGYTSLQWAIDASQAGDIITATCPGEYDGPINFNGHAITLTSTHGAEATTIVGNGVSSVVFFAAKEGQSSILSGFSITNGGGTLGSGIYVSGGSPTLRDLILHDNYATGETSAGGGLALIDSAASLEQVQVLNNHSDGRGGGIYLLRSRPTLRESEIAQSSANLGGGIYMENSTPFFKGIIIRGNTARNDGGGLYLLDSSPQLFTTTVSQNLGVNGGGLMAIDSSPELTDCVVEQNEAYYGGGIGLLRSAGQISRCTFEANEGLRQGGGMYMESSSPRLSECLLQRNMSGSGDAFGEGGGMYLYASSPEITDTELTGNKAKQSGGGAALVNSSPRIGVSRFAQNSAGQGGGIFLRDSSPILSDSDWDANSATVGAGLYLQSSRPAMWDCTVSRNVADQLGGGLALFDSSPALFGLQIESNDTDGSGGGLYLERSNPVLTQLTVIQNRAAVGGGLALSFSSPMGNNLLVSANEATGLGGGLAMSNANPALTNCVFELNQAGLGGAIAAETSSPVLSSLALLGNQATEAGGGIWIKASSPILKNAVLVENSSALGGGLYLVGLTELSIKPRIFSSILAENLGYNLYAEDAAPVLLYSDLYSLPGEDNHTLSSLDSSNLLLEPGFLSGELSGLPSDLHLAETSALIDLGDPACVDPDGSRCDLGVYGGSYGASWDLDGDDVPSWFWPGPFSAVPAGIDPTEFDCSDQDPDRTTCPGI